MDLEKFLIKTLQKRFSANATIKAIEKEIIYIAEEVTFEKYKDTILNSDGLEFELGGVKAELDYFWIDLVKPKLNLTLGYFCKSELPKAKRERVEKEKNKFNEGYPLYKSTHKVKLWHYLTYNERDNSHVNRISIDRALNGMIRLDIKL